MSILKIIISLSKTHVFTGNMHFMNFRKLLIFCLLIVIQYSFAQGKKDVLFTVAEEPVYTDEFIKVYNKNRDIVAEEDKKTLDEYLELYINYKLKLKEAYDLKYDTILSYQNELATYREQLTLPYLKDSNVTDELVREAYERTKTEVSASHILIRVNPDASPADTLKAYNKVMEARAKVIAGTPFEVVARAYSEDPSAKQNGGNLGYFSAFSMVYPFENAAYQTKTNEVSMPFKTRFGYHIVKVNDYKDSRGEIEVAHIMIKDNPQDSSYARNKIKEVYAQVLQTGNFELMAKMHSDDKNSGVNGGKLPRFSEHRMIASFSEVAFALKNPGDISKPFETPYGWHILKLIKYHPVGSFEEMKVSLYKKIENSERSRAAGESVINRLKAEYKIVENTAVLDIFFSKDTGEIGKNKREMLFSINDVPASLDELLSYQKKYQKENLNTVYNDFLDEKIMEYFKTHLHETNEDFSFTLSEYRDGLLLFEILQDKIWKRAEKDTIALQNFFNEHRDAYSWPKRADVIIAQCSRQKKAEEVKKYLENNVSLDSIKNRVNDGAIIHVLFTNGIVDESHRKLPRNFTFEKTGVSQVIKQDNNAFLVVKVLKIIEPEPMVLKDAKGSVINDFQQDLETKWINDLRHKYPVQIHKRSLKKLKKEFKE